MAIEQELEWFENNRQLLLETYASKFLIVKDRKVHGSFDSAEAAYGGALAKFGPDGFLIKQVLVSDPVEHMPAVWLGTLSASI